LKHKTVAFAGSAASPAQFPRDGLPEVAFLGRSNVGKSSLLNALAGTKGLARVSSTPGRTQLLNFFRVSGLGAGPEEAKEIYLVDLPGYGYARVPEGVRRGWENLIAGYLQKREPLRLSVFLVDARHEPTEGDLTLRAYLDHYRLPYIVAATKADKLGRGEALAQRRTLARNLGANARGVVAVSAITGVGVDDLWREIRGATAPN
jgi:GTP-binding protein